MPPRCCLLLSGMYKNGLSIICVSLPKLFFKLFEKPKKFLFESRILWFTNKKAPPYKKVQAGSAENTQGTKNGLQASVKIIKQNRRRTCKFYSRKNMISFPKQHSKTKTVNTLNPSRQ